MNLGAFRLIHERWLHAALGGEGAALYPGRWNNKGERVVYLSSALSLAVLETRVHAQIALTEEPYWALEFSFASSLVKDLESKHDKRGSDMVLPKNWREDVTVTRELGSRWLHSGASLLLRVPSVVVPNEYNYLFNPNHAKLKSIKEVSRFRFNWDSRLF